MDKHKIRQLLKMSEGPKLDFKAKLSLETESEKKELAKDVTAIANSKGGRGYIIFGVEDKTKRILGIDPEDYTEEQVQQVIYNRCDPPVALSFDVVALDDRELGIITIFRSNNKPHQMIQNGAFYIRRGSTTDIARRSEIANLLQENGLMVYETVILKNVDMEQLDRDKIQQYFRSLNVESENPSEVLLEAMGIIGQIDDSGEYHPTIGGLLLFGKNPSLFLPHVYIKVLFKDEIRYFYGDLLSLLDQTMEYLKSVICDTDFDFGAAEEVIANALVHRDYIDTSRGISIAINDKNIEISNPGSLVSGNNVYRIIKENNPDRRNSWLYQRIVTLDGKKRFMKTGVTLEKIKEAFKEVGEVKFLNIGSQNLFKVILPRGKDGRR